MNEYLYLHLKDQYKHYHNQSLEFNKTTMHGHVDKDDEIDVAEQSIEEGFKTVKDYIMEQAKKDSPRTAGMRLTALGLAYCVVYDTASTKVLVWIYNKFLVLDLKDFETMYFKLSEANRYVKNLIKENKEFKGVKNNGR